MRKSTVVAVSIAVVMAVPLTLYASHQFQDVPDSHTFHTAIDFMAANGITQGCNPPANTNYCPEDPVTRGQMAGFLKRFHDTFIAGAGTGLGIAFRNESTPPDPGNGVVEGLNLNLRIPQAGILVVEANVQMVNDVDFDALACGINTGGALTTAHPGSWRVVDLTASAATNCDTVAVGIASPGGVTVRVVTSGALNTTDALQGTLSAALYTEDGAFPLLGAIEEATEAPVLSDVPKGAD